MEGLAGLLVAIVVLCLIAYLVFWGLAQIPLPEPVRVIITVLVALLFLIVIVRQFGLLSGFALPPGPEANVWLLPVGLPTNLWVWGVSFVPNCNFFAG